MWTNLLLSALLAAVLCLKVNAHPWFQARIPNGAIVPNPCNLSTIWPGVGHKNVYGAGDRNSFGLDFAANNFMWNRTLCMKDSDGDGMTNGQELGDPNCNWTEGSTPMFSTNLTHPGVCQPLGSPMCSEMNFWLLNCSPKTLDCPAISQSDAQNYTMQFPVTPVPTQETTYICYQFKLPSDTVSDIIAIEPVIDNALVLHHMLLYACTNQPTDSPADEAFECGMGSGMYCRAMIGTWGVGIAGQCLNSQLGFRIGGSDGFQYAILQLHWNNPLLKSNLTDSSGMRIYYTTQLRPNRGQVAIVGQIYLEIPPGQPDVTFTGNCSSLCTRHLPHSIFITSTVLHMHTLGKSGDVRLIRNGQLVRTLENVTKYDYNTPRLLEYATPIEVKPGDEIQVNCVYDSTKRNTTTYYGEATSDEMCYGFFAYYPLIENIGFCGQRKTINICSNRYDTEFESCDYNTFKKLIVFLPYVCTGLENCTTTSCAVIMNGILATGCQNYPDVREYTYSEIFEQCLMEMPPSTTANPPVSSSTGTYSQSTQQQQPSLTTTSDSSGQSATSCLCFVIILIACAFKE